MPRYNINSGYGQIVGQFPFTGSGKVMFVGDSGTANRTMLQELFRNDSDGEVRFFATIDAAVSAGTANAGDIIYVAAGHTESIVAATTLALDVAGVQIIGLGTGADRPTLTFTTATTATLDVTAANITLENIIIDLTGVDAVAIGIDVSAAGFTMRSCKILMSDSSGQAVIGLFADTSADNMTLENNEFVTFIDITATETAASVAGQITGIELKGSDLVKIKNNVIIGAFDHTSGAAILMDGHACTNIDISGNFIQDMTTRAEVVIKGTTSITGVISNNLLRISTDAKTKMITGQATASAGIAFGAASLYLNYGVNADSETGFQLGDVSV